MTSPTNESFFERAQAVMPGGVSSPVRAFRSVGGIPYFVADANGAWVTDVEGNRYLDYVQSYGAVILGHAHPAVVAAVREAAAHGTTYGAPTLGEVLLCEELVGRVPGLEMVRLVSSGTEAGMSAFYHFRETHADSVTRHEPVGRRVDRARAAPTALRIGARHPR